jgi:Domain of unknown function (DUF927)
MSQSMLERSQSMNTVIHNTKSAIRKIARIEDKATGEFLEEIEFPVGSTEVRRLQLLPSVVNDSGRLEDCLVDRGAKFPDVHDRKSLLADVAKSDAANRYTYAARGGWTEPGKTFVLPDGAISSETTDIIGVSPSVVINDPSGKRTTDGSLLSWRDTVGQLSRLSSLLMFASSVALAAPLLAMTSGQSFGFCLYGRTRSGKTIATLVASSIIGIGRTENLIGWNITDARLEQRLAEFSDLLFPIDDLSTMPGSNKEKYSRIRNLSYRVSQGWATGRHSSFTMANEGVHGGWRCIALTSSEKSIQDMAKDAKVERQHGEVLRLIDVPALLEGSSHIFDRASSDVLVKDFTSWRDSTFASIVNDCNANHGAALKAYLEKIIAADFNVSKTAREHIVTFVAHVARGEDDVVARDVAAKFGLVYAGGMLGIRLGVVPWQQDELLDAISKCYLGARDLLPDEGVALRQGLGLLRGGLQKLLRLKSLPKEQRASHDWESEDGYWRRKAAKDIHVIKREAFNSLFATTAQRDLVLKWLIENNRITTALAKTGAAANSPAPKEQFIWPDDERRRSYEITVPRF